MDTPDFESMDITGSGIEKLGAGVEVDFKTLIFIQISRINYAIGQDVSLFLSYVLALESMLAPYIDQIYRDEKAEAQKELKFYYNHPRIKAHKNTYQDFLLEKEKAYGLKVYHALSRLAQRERFYPKPHVRVSANDPNVSPLNEVKNRLLKKNQNWLCAITGQTGTGKSYAGLSMASYIDPNFNINNVVFSVEEFMERLNDKNEETKLRKGSVIIFDEAGVGIPNRDWQNIQNKLFGHIMETFRNDNIAVIFTMPIKSFVDKKSKLLLHSHLTTERIDRKNNLTHIKWLDQDYNEILDKTYNTFPVIQAEGDFHRARSITIKKPPRKLIKEYEKKKREFTENLKHSVEMTLTKMKESVKSKSDDELLEIIRNEYPNKIPTRSEIRILLKPYGVGGQISSDLRTIIEKERLAKTKEKTESESI